VKIKKAIKFISFGLLTILVIGVLGIFLWSKIGTYPAGEVATAALQSTNRVTVTQDRWIIFTPVEMGETGLIFYPGGLVEPAAYAPILHKISEEGVLVIIVPMPLNLAILNPGAADAVIGNYPKYHNGFLPGIHWEVPQQQYLLRITLINLMGLPFGIPIRLTLPTCPITTFQRFPSMGPRTIFPIRIILTTKGSYYRGIHCSSQ